MIRGLGGLGESEEFDCTNVVESHMKGLDALIKDIKSVLVRPQFF